MNLPENVLEPPEYIHCEECSTRFYPADDESLCYDCLTSRD
jgi:hypothetical protein